MKWLKEQGSNVSGLHKVQGPPRGHVLGHGLLGSTITGQISQGTIHEINKGSVPFKQCG